LLSNNAAKANLAILHISDFFKWTPAAGNFDKFDTMLVKQGAGFELLLLLNDEVVLEGDNASIRALADRRFADRVAAFLGEEMQRRKVKVGEKGGEYVA
jgi:hypothetical protein